MGNENIVKDPNIQIFLELKHLIYHPTQKIKGSIYIQAKQYSLYSDLILKIQCFQKTQFKEKKDKNNQPLVEQRRTYFDQMKIAEFVNGLYKGQHQFPFSVTLPLQLTGSLVLSSNDYIRYKITVYLQSTSPQITNQLHSRQIWIIQKFRGTIEPIFSRQQQQPKCCMWGYSWGWIKTQIQCQTNNIEPGQKVKLKFQINTYRMNSQVKKAKIRLIEKNIIVTNEYFQQKQASELFAFDFNQSSIEKNQIKKMQKSIIFPVDLNPTAIGQILSRIYLIQVYLSFNCYSELKQYLHVFVSSNKNGLKQQNKPFIKPKIWKPQKYKKLEFNKLKKYEYKPDPRILYHNEFKHQANKLQAMKVTQPGSNRRISI